MNVLFVCGKARMRSPTAADLVRNWPGIHADFAGLSNDADEQLSSEHIDWADLIAVMETRQKKRLTALFGPAVREKRVVVLSVPDRYDYGDPDLIARLEPILRRILPS
ncbi:MAG: phosphotyrosine protein phosphatase [Sedimentitalea sp.]